MTEPFIGSEALASGVLNRYELGRHHRLLMPKIYVDKRAALSLQQRITAAWLWSGRDGVIAGAAASALHGARWVAHDVPIELISTKIRAPTGVITRRDTVHDDEVTLVDGMSVTSVERTAFDLGRRGLIGSAVARLDALARATGFKGEDVLRLADRHRHARGLRQLERALDLFDPGGHSPQETRLRLTLIGAGFPKPQTQIPVLGPDANPIYFIDMGWEELMLAVEYEGMQHADSLGYDIMRGDYIAHIGWTHVRVAAGHRKPSVIVRVEREWGRLWRPGLGLAPRTAPLPGPPLDRMH
ncbi:hypothetical protein [Mycolicibacterium aubagnense]|nr:hypothetical protein [Mycolicibacterium aubagnense]WGI32623.1 hypothetical protein QDT91_26260 [Mycolicibacterium aubagnense]